MRPETQKIILYVGTSIGVLGGLIGMAVAIAAAPLYGSIFSLFFIVVFGWIFGGLYLRGRKTKQLLENGRRANGKIVELWDTGMTINNQPQIGMYIDVTPDSEPPFRAEVKQVISRLQTSYYQVGVTCVVRYDPNNKKTVAIESLGGSSDFNNNVSGYNSNSYQDNPTSSYFPGMSQQQITEAIVANDQELKRIMQIGVECKAIIKSSDFTNLYVNQTNPLYSLVLEVLPNDSPAYEAKTLGLIMPASVPKFQPGKQIFVKYDPADRSKVTVSHS